MDRFKNLVSWVGDMTVINAMKFGNNSGGLIADSQASTNVSKYDISEKTNVYQSKDGTRIVIGGTGNTFVLHEIQKRLSREYSGDRDFGVSDLTNALSDIMTGIGRDFVDRELKDRYGFSSQEYVAGRLVNGTPIGQHILGPAGEVYTGRDPEIAAAKNNAFLVIGNDSQGTHLYHVVIGGRPVLSAFPYGGTGSGETNLIKHYEIL
jgi:hypothetical protein